MYTLYPLIARHHVFLRLLTCLALYLWLFTTAISCPAQSLHKLVRQSVNTSRLTVSHGDSVETFTLASRPARHKPDESRFYSWYTSGSIKQTQGGYAGKLLDGIYTLFTHQKSLLAQGNYQHGLRTGTWKYWYVPGQLKRTEQWKNGLLHGRYYHYAADGSVQEKGTFRNGQLHGHTYTYTYTASGQTLVQKDKYRHGKLIVPKPKKEKPKKEKVKKKEKESKPTERKHGLKNWFKGKKTNDTTASDSPKQTEKKSPKKPKKQKQVKQKEEKKQDTPTKAPTG